MQQFIAQVRIWAELLYFLSGVLLAVMAIYGLQQVTLLKRDMRLRSERAAKEKAIEYAQRYLTVYVPLEKKFFDECRSKELSGYEGPVGEFTAESIPKQYRLNGIKRFEVRSWLSALNELQIIAAAYVTGVADEQVGFEIIGRTFCFTVRDKYDILVLCRSEKACPYYDSIVRLYKIWAPRLQKSELGALRDDISSLIERLPDTRVFPLGQDESGPR